MDENDEEYGVKEYDNDTFDLETKEDLNKVKNTKVVNRFLNLIINNILVAIIIIINIFLQKGVAVTITGLLIIFILTAIYFDIDDTKKENDDSNIFYE